MLYSFNSTAPPSSTHDEDSDETESIAVAISLCDPLFNAGNSSNQEIESFLKDKKKVSTDNFMKNFHPHSYLW